jgi:hypothetical protein
MRVSGSGAEWGGQVAHGNKPVDDPPRRAHGFPERSGGPPAGSPPTPRPDSGGPKHPASSPGLQGLHLGQIKNLAKDLEAQGRSLDRQAIEQLTNRLADVLEKLGHLTNLIQQSGMTPTAPSFPPQGGQSGGAGSTGGGGATSSSGSASGGGRAGGSGSAGNSSGTRATDSLVYLKPFSGPTDFGSITVNGVTTTIGIIDATGGLSANQVAGSLVNILNSNPDNVFTAQQRDTKIMLVAKEAGTTLTVDDIAMGTSGTSGFAGFFDGMSGTGTLMSNPILAVR